MRKSNTGTSERYEKKGKRVSRERASESERGRESPPREGDGEGKSRNRVSKGSLKRECVRECRASG